MSVESLAVVLHHSQATGTDKLVLVGIANHDGDGGAWPTVETLARYANVHERNVQRAIDRLVKAGELAVQRQAGGTGNVHAFQRPNLYRIQVVCPPSCDRSTRHRPRVIHSPEPLPGLPQSDPVAPAPPDGASATPRVAPVPPKPSNNHPATTGRRSVTGPRASSGQATCSQCNRTESACRRLHGLGGDTHEFTPAIPRQPVPAMPCGDCSGGRLVLDQSTGHHVCSSCGSMSDPNDESDA